MLSLSNIGIEGKGPGTEPLAVLTGVRSGRNEIQDPGDQQTDADELNESFCSVPTPLAHASSRKRSEANGDEKSEADKIKEMDHFFLPRLISIASITAR